MSDWASNGDWANNGDWLLGGLAETVTDTLGLTDDVSYVGGGGTAHTRTITSTTTSTLVDV